MNNGFDNFDNFEPYAITPHNAVISKIKSVNHALISSYNKHAMASDFKYKVTTGDIDITLTSTHAYTCMICKQKHNSQSIRKLSCDINGKHKVTCHNQSRYYYKQETNKELHMILNEHTLQSRVDDFLHIDTTGIEVITEDSNFISCDKNNRFQWRSEYLTSKFIIMNASMGKGKTSFILKYMKMLEILKQKELSCLFLSQRKTFSNFICSEFEEFGLINYQTLKGTFSHPRLCVQIESLHKVHRYYDVIIMDESETLLNQFSSSTMKYVQECWGNLKDQIANCKHCIVADAFILQRSIDFVNHFKGKKIMINNTKQYLNGRKAIQISDDTFNESIINELKSDKRVVNISTCRDDLLVLKKLVTEQLPDKKMKVYDKDSDKTELNIVNRVWKDLDFVGYTPVIQTGISYMDKLFDVAYANLKSSNLARDAMQMLLRCRELKDNTLYFSTSNQRITDNDIEMFDTYERFSKINAVKLHMIIKSLSGNNGAIESIIQSMIDSDDLLKRILWHNVREYMLSKYHYNELCLRMLTLQGYEVETLADNLCKRRINVKMGLNEMIFEYTDIKPVIGTELTMLKHLNGSKSRLMVSKYYFEQIIETNISDEIKSKLFFENYEVNALKAKLFNIRNEKTNTSMENIIKYDCERADSVLSKVQMTAHKLKHITALNKILRLSNSTQDKHIISKSIMMNDTHHYITNNIKELKLLFESNCILKGCYTTDNFIIFKLIEKIYNSWSGLQFKSHTKSKNKTTSYITIGNNCFDHVRAFATYNDYAAMSD